jgi:acetylornithine aminotransferase
VFFCNSGAEANEAALKLSRKTGRSRVVSTIGSFHGRTMGALSITGQSAKRDIFKPILPGVKHVPFGEVKALKSAVNRKTAMLIIEPIQGENGVIVPPPGYLRAAREICDANGALLVLDCVQTGMGRTGTFFGFEDEEISPDVITLAKGLGGGLPIGAMIAIGPAAHLFKPGDHGSTFGGNPIAAAAGLAVICEIERAKLLSNALKMSKLLTKQLSNISGVSEVRGKGLLIGIGLTNPIANEISNKLLEKGVLVNAPNPNTIRIAPALILNSREVERFIKIFNEVMNG